MSLEFNAVRDPLIRYLTEIDWNYLDPKELVEHRGKISELFLLPILKQKIKELNKGVMETDEQVDEVIKKLRNVGANLTGNQDFRQYLRGEKTIYAKKEKREIDVRLIGLDKF
jgi:type I restriction enzyme R subunit